MLKFDAKMTLHTVPPSDGISQLIRNFPQLLWQRLTVLAIVFLALPSRVTSLSIPPSFSDSTPPSLFQHSTSVHSPPPPQSSSSVSRLDYITVIVICGVVAFCFVICIVVGCRRRKKQHQRRARRFEDLLPNEISRSVTETDGPTNSVANASSNYGNRSPVSGRRGLESPPPTYSIIERQTSFTSHVSQTSSMIEVPPDYEDAWDPDKSADSSIDPSHQMPRSASARVRRSARNGASRPVERAESGPGGIRQPPRAGGRRSHSDVADAHRKPRRRISSRPGTVSEDDAASDANTTMRSIDVIAEVSSRSSAIIEGAAADAVAESITAESVVAGSVLSNDSMRPLISSSDKDRKDPSLRYPGPSTVID